MLRQACLAAQPQDSFKATALREKVALKEATSGSSAVSSPDKSTAESFPNSEVERLTVEGLGRFSLGDFAGAVLEFTSRKGSTALQESE